MGSVFFWSLFLGLHGVSLHLELIPRVTLIQSSSGLYSLGYRGLVFLWILFLGSHGASLLLDLGSDGVSLLLDLFPKVT